uniref:Ig-like domain-containing protein n=1 Tax=Sparus aurata TaxID=8175 RepID=A0A671UV66_SPAAU
MTVEWTRPDLNPRFVHVWRDGVELENKKHPSYNGRTSVFVNKLRCGDISLNLSKVRLSDSGKYRCFIPTLGRESTVELVVGVVSSIVISSERTGKDEVSSRVVLQCESAGWYPEPEVFWLDGEGNLLSAGPTETVRGPDDLYTVSSRVTVEKRHSNSFTCRVQQNSTNQIREALIHVPEDVLMEPSSSVVPIIVVFSFVCVLLLSALVFVVWKLRQNRSRKLQIGCN